MATRELVGTPTPLMDGRAKVTGALRFAGDLQIPGMLYAKFVSSVYPHANIKGIDKSAAMAMPGVVAVLTAADFPAIVPTSRTRLLLARERVIFVGQPIALVLATTEAAAEDALDAVRVDYEPLPAVTLMDEALAPDAPLVWPNGIPKGSDDASMHGAGSSGEAVVSDKHTNVVKEILDERGDIEGAFAEAYAIVERTFTTASVHQSYLEPQSMLAQPDPMTGGVTIWASTQGQFPVREEVAATLNIPEANVRVVGAPVGGGFGGKIVLYEPLVALAAVTVGRPIRLVLTRMEELAAANPAPAARVWLRLGAKRDGTLTALHAKITVDSGCYSSGLGGIIAFLLGSVYQIPNFRLETTEVLTFKASASAYRAPGAPSAAFALETEIDELARQLDLDPMEMRLKNASHTGDPMSDDKPWASIGMRDVLEALQSHPAWQGREEAHTAGRGIGIAIGGWTGGVEPTAAACMVDRDGTVTIHVGSADLSGTGTSFALIAAEVFGVSPDKVHINMGDTANAPYAGVAAGSKTMYTVGPAVAQAAQEARAQVLAIAAEEFEADPADLDIVDGMIRVRGVPDRQMSVGDIAAKGFQWDSKYGPIIAHGRHANTESAPGFCAQLAEVEVDQETGEVRVVRLVVVQDAGQAINPLAVEGQMLGGSVQGLGWALYEQIAYSDEGQLLTGSWMDYTVPAITQAAGQHETVIVEVPTDNGPFGARGVGEPPVIATAAAVANAIADVTGARLQDLPMTPPRVMAALATRGNLPRP
jgi:CO/xanthine dehydrogenase Mo-binding subunit